MRFSRLVDAAGNFLELRSLGDLLLLRRSGAFLEGVSFTGASPLTTKGDLLVHNGTSVVRLAVGANSRRFVADSSTTEGVRWATIFSATVTRTAAAGSGSQAIAHGLGVAPNIIELDINADEDDSICSSGTAHGAAVQSCIRGLAGTIRVDLTRIGNVVSVNGYQIALASADATNITLTWTVAGIGLAVTGRLYARV